MHRKPLVLIVLLALLSFACQFAGLQPAPTPTATLPALTATWVLMPELFCLAREGV